MKRQPTGAQSAAGSTKANKIHLAAKCILDHLPKGGGSLRRDLHAECSYYLRVPEDMAERAWIRFVSSAVFVESNRTVLEAGFMAVTTPEGAYVEEFLVLLSTKHKLTWNTIAQRFILACKYDKPKRDKDS